MQTTFNEADWWKDPRDFIERHGFAPGVETLADDIIGPAEFITYEGLDAMGHLIASETAMKMVSAYRTQLSSGWDRAITRPSGGKGKLRGRVLGTVCEKLAVRMLDAETPDMLADDVDADGHFDQQRVVDMIRSECQEESPERKRIFHDDLSGLDRPEVARLVTRIARRTAVMLPMAGFPIRGEEGGVDLHRRVDGSPMCCGGQADVMVLGVRSSSIPQKQGIGIVDIKCRTTYASKGHGHWNPKMQSQLIIYAVLSSWSSSCEDRGPAFVATLNPVLGCIESMALSDLVSERPDLVRRYGRTLGLSDEETERVVDRFENAGWLPVY